MNPASWAWVAFAADLVLFVTGFDLWAHFTGHQSMSGQLEQWLGGAVTGPLVVGLFGGLFVALWWHWLVMSRAKGNGDEVPEAIKDKLGKILDRAHREQAEREAYRQARAGTRGGEPKTVRDAYDQKMGYRK